MEQQKVVRMQSNSEATIIGLVGGVYAAALDASRWPDVLQNTASAVGSPAGTVWMHDFASSTANFDSSNGNVAAVMGFDDVAIDSFAAHYGGGKCLDRCRGPRAVRFGSDKLNAFS